MIKRLLGLEKQEQRNYTDLVTQAILMRATVEDAYTGALEVASGFVGRAFASAEAVGSGSRYFDSAVLTEIGRDLIERGESAWKIEVGGVLRYLPHYDVMADGRYETGTGVPIASENVLHVRYHTDYHTLRGIGPLQKAGGLTGLLSKIETSMHREAGSTVGYVLPVPGGGDVDQLKEDLKRMQGEIAVVETTSGGYDAGRSNAPMQDFVAKRLGANVPETSILLYKYATNLALTACGVPSELLENSGEGTGQREAWRRFMFGTLVPLGKLVTAHAARKGIDVSLNFDDLMASDIAGRARAFGSLVTAGMDVEDAAILTGLITQEEE